MIVQRSRKSWESASGWRVRRRMLFSPTTLPQCDFTYHQHWFEWVNVLEKLTYPLSGLPGIWELKGYITPGGYYVVA